MLMICAEETEPVGPAEHRAMPEFITYAEQTERMGVRRGGNRLRPSSDATTVHVRDGEIMITDGPFAETKDQMGGYDLIECADLDSAIEIAALHPVAKVGRIEIRPLWDE
ncbi:MAG TPA: YciI family protein [Mycobacteriales bacterium]|nr:YciI family protein [Mycobacteriales bacterium]